MNAVKRILVAAAALMALFVAAPAQAGHWVQTSSSGSWSASGVNSGAFWGTSGDTLTVSGATSGTWTQVKTYNYTWSPDFTGDNPVEVKMQCEDAFTGASVYPNGTGGSSMPGGGGGSLSPYTYSGETVVSLSPADPDDDDPPNGQHSDVVCDGSSVVEDSFYVGTTLFYAEGTLDGSNTSIEVTRTCTVNTSGSQGSQAFEYEAAAPALKPASGAAQISPATLAANLGDNYNLPETPPATGVRKVFGSPASYSTLGTIHGWRAEQALNGTGATNVPLLIRVSSIMLNGATRLDVRYGWQAKLGKGTSLGGTQSASVQHTYTSNSGAFTETLSGSNGLNRNGAGVWNLVVNIQGSVELNPWSDPPLKTWYTRIYIRPTNP